MIVFIKETTPGHAPEFKTAGAAGADLKAANSMPVELKPGRSHAIPCGFEMELPKGYEAQIRPRSGLAIGHHVTVLNSPGTIDSDYRGQVSVILINHGGHTLTINPGDRVAQMVIQEVPQIEFMVVDQLNDTERGSNGFGSTGV